MQTAPDGIAVSGDSDITDVEQLAGQTVGLVSDRDRVTMQIALDARGMTENDVTTVVVGEAGPTLAAAFRDQTVAAIAGSGPDWLAIQANGIPRRTDHARGGLEQARQHLRRHGLDARGKGRR